MRPRRSLILEVSVDAIFHTALLFSLFLLFRGHNAPGGGFVGGLVAAAALVLRWVHGGAEALPRTVRVPPNLLIGGGLALSVITGIVPLALGSDLLESDAWSADAPLLGTIKTTSALPFDVGVYLVVVGLGLGVLRTLGEEADR